MLKGRVLRDGSGSGQDPYKYHLLGMIEKWQVEFPGGV
jgi:hypothetical protein